MGDSPRAPLLLRPHVLNPSKSSFQSEIHPGPRVFQPLRIVCCAGAGSHLTSKYWSARSVGWSCWRFARQTIEDVGCPGTRLTTWDTGLGYPPPVQLGFLPYPRTFVGVGHVAFHILISPLPAMPFSVHVLSLMYGSHFLYLRQPACSSDVDTGRASPIGREGYEYSSATQRGTQCTLVCGACVQMS